MVPLTLLWLPIVVSAIVVFIAASVVWMVLPHHRTDYRQLPEEDRVIEALRAGDTAAGQYHFPFVRSWKDASAELKQRVEQGPAGFLILRPPGKFAMGKQMALYFLWLLAISVFIAYITGRSVPAGIERSEVFRFAATTAILGYAGAIFPNSIWYSRPWRVTWKEFLDAVVYGILAGAIFAWLWPS